MTSAQPKPLLLLKVNTVKRETPSMHVLAEGDDVATRITELLGGPPEQEIPPHPAEAQVGVTSVHGRGDYVIAVHTSPVAQEMLGKLIARFEEESRLMQLLRDIGVGVREDGCFCGQCPLPGEEEQIDDGTSRVPS